MLDTTDLFVRLERHAADPLPLRAWALVAHHRLALPGWLTELAADLADLRFRWCVEADPFATLEMLAAAPADGPAPPPTDDPRFVAPGFGLVRLRPPSIEDAEHLCVPLSPDGCWGVLCGAGIDGRLDWAWAAGRPAPRGRRHGPRDPHPVEVVEAHAHAGGVRVRFRAAVCTRLDPCHWTPFRAAVPPICRVERDGACWGHAGRFPRPGGRTAYDARCAPFVPTPGFPTCREMRHLDRRIAVTGLPTVLPDQAHAPAGTGWWGPGPAPKRRRL